MEGKSNFVSSFYAFSFACSIKIGICRLYGCVCSDANGIRSLKLESRCCNHCMKLLMKDTL